MIDEKVLIGGFEKREIKICDYDPSWVEKFQRHAQIVAAGAR